MVRRNASSLARNQGSIGAKNNNWYFYQLCAGSFKDMVSSFSGQYRSLSTPCNAVRLAELSGRTSAVECHSIFATLSLTSVNVSRFGRC